MTGRDRDELVGILTRGSDGSPVTLAGLCRACLKVLGADAAAIVLMTDGRQGAACASNDLAGAVQDLEFTLGEGPATDAHAWGAPVVVDDMAALDGRWPQFRPACSSLGVGSALAFPLQVGAIRLGVLSVYFGSRQRLDVDGELDESILVADVVAQVVLGLQSQVASETLAWALEDATEYRAVVHQATGMVAAQLDCKVEEGLVRLRAFAFSADRPLHEVASDIVGRVLRLDRDDR